MDVLQLTVSQGNNMAMINDCPRLARASASCMLSVVVLDGPSLLVVFADDLPQENARV